MARRPFNNSMTNWLGPFIFLFVLFSDNVSANKEGYYGKYIGKLSQLHHGVSGDVFAVDARTLHLRNFNYDGEGPAAYFYAGNSKVPSGSGFRLRDERGTTNVLPKYRNKHITITLPEGKTLQNIKWFSVWCDEFSVNFGDVKIPKNLDFPKPQKISGLSGVHGVSSEPIVIVDAQTLLVPSFSYDGEAPDAKFWVGAGLKPTPRGIRIPDENGKEVPLRRYDRKTIVLTLPGELTIFDIGHFGVWCEAFTVDFGHVQIPKGLNVPPSLKMLGVSPQSKLNCEVLWDDFAYEVRWAVAGDSIVLQLVARLENNEYMSFGLSGDKSRSRMVGGDVVVAWVDKESLKGYAEDYYLDAKSQCSGGRGSCPDEKIQEGAGSVRLLNAALVNGYSIVTFQRSLRAQDELDGNFLTNGSQPVIWAIGPLNSRKEVSYHNLVNRGDIFIDFGRAPKWNCPTPESVADQSGTEDDSTIPGGLQEGEIEETNKQVQVSNTRESPAKSTVPTPAPVSKSRAWEIPAIKCHEPEDGVFYAQMGPTGGKHGYSAITGHVGWGISWYINGLLIPEINVVRGRTYTFIVEGGLDPETPARYHPFYITDDPVGGYQYKTPEERINIQIFAGAVQNKRGEVRPTGIGRLCNWTPDPNQPPADEFASFGAYQRTLRLECDPGNPGIIQWTVDKDTPDTVYYQCYTHRYLGWKINVHDHCESEAGSEPVPAIVKPPEDFLTDSQGSESINYEVRVRPNQDYFVTKNQTVESEGEYVKGGSASSLDLGVWNDRFGVKSVQDKEKVKVSRPPVSGNGQPKPVQTHASETSQQSHQHFKSSVFVAVNGEESARIPTSDHTPGLSSYSVTEVPVEDFKDHQLFQNFQILPSKLELQLPYEFASHPFQKNPPKTKLAFLDSKRNTEKKEGSIYKTSQIFAIQPEDKLKKHNLKTEYRAKLPVRPSNAILGASSTPYKRKPSTVGVVTLQQRPFPPSAFRPPSLTKPSKRPGPAPSALLNTVPLQTLVHPFKFQVQAQQPVQLHLEGNPISTAQQRPQKMHFAQNTGFDPDSVKVEGGFKPILTTERESSRFNVIDRADVQVEDDNRTDQSSENLKETHTEGTSTTSERNHQEGIAAKETLPDDVNPFKNQTPQQFEPIFIPSVPDNMAKASVKYQDKAKKKTNSKYGNGQTVPEEETIYVTRSNPNYMRRPFYSQNIVPPPRISPRGNTLPKFRPRLDSEEPEELDLFDRNPGNAGSILEIMELKNHQTENVTADEIAMADEVREVYASQEAREFRSYDGKVVQADSAPTLSGPTSFADVSKLPQFAPYKGAIPPLSDSVSARDLPQLNGSKLARDAILPPQSPTVDKERGNTERVKRSPDHGLPHGDDHDHDHGDDHHHHHHDHDHDHDHDHSGHRHFSGSSGHRSLPSAGLFVLAFIIGCIYL